MGLAAGGREQPVLHLAELVAALLWGASLRWNAYWRRDLGNFEYTNLGMSRGGFVAARGERSGLVGRPGHWEWRVETRRAGDRLLWVPRASVAPPGAFLPVWLPLVCSAGLALYCWRKHGGSQCRCVCGYSLAGLGAGAVCPECGRGPA